MKRQYVTFLKNGQKLATSQWRGNKKNNFFGTPWFDEVKGSSSWTKTYFSPGTDGLCKQDTILYCGKFPEELKDEKFIPIHKIGTK